MSMQDPVADMLTCIRNAQAMGIENVLMPHSNLKCRNTQCLDRRRFIENFES